MFRVGVNNHGFIRGGNWNNGTNAGAFTLNLNNAPTNTNTNIGFRVARSLSSTVRESGLARVSLGHGRWQRAIKDLPFMPILAGLSREILFRGVQLNMYWWHVEANPSLFKPLGLR